MRKKKTKVTDKNVENRLKKGLSVKQIAKDLGTTAIKVRRLVHRLNMMSDHNYQPEGLEIINKEIDVNVKLRIHSVPYKKRKLPKELDEFCGKLEKKVIELMKRIKGSNKKIGWQLEGQIINEERKVFFNRKGKYGLHIDWSSVKKEYIEKTKYYLDDGKWHTLSDVIKVLFADDWSELEPLLEIPKVKITDNEALISFSKLLCKDAINWDDTEHGNWVVMDKGGC